MTKNLVYTNRTVNFADWCGEAQDKFKLVGLPPFDETILAAKHAYELGYTPDSWAREMNDRIIRSARAKEFKKFNSR